MAAKQATPIAPCETLIDHYLPAPAVCDEMRTAQGEVRSHWRYLLDVLTQLGPAGLEERKREARRLIRDNGVTYNVYGDPQGMARPWELDLIPLLLRSEEWTQIERGLMQRAELMNQLFLDLYGPQRLLKKGVLPAELVYSHPGFLLACHGIEVARDRPLVMYAVDLTRARDGQWRVLGDRTQSPSGAGYALENRVVLSRVLPSLFRDSHVHRLAGFYRAVRRAMRTLAPRRHSASRVAVLTPGPSNEAYFEHAYLANYLGYTLVQGADLSVRDGALWLKTLERLERIDVVLRRVDDIWCDPLDLRDDSLLGVPGLVQAVRSGNVTLANALGATVLEHPGLMGYLPGICRELLGEDLLLTGVQTWWCGNARQREFVLQNLERLVIKPVTLDPRRRCIFCPELDPAALTLLRDQLQAHPERFVAQEYVPLSTAPVLLGNCIEPRPTVLRSFLVAEEDGYTVMPGGLSRVAADGQTLAVSNQLGGIGKDTWVLASEPERQETLLMPGERQVPLISQESDVSSRVADNLFWIGRYAERAEGLVRMLRIIVFNLTERMSLADPSTQTGCLQYLLRALTHQTLTYPGYVGEGAEQRMADPYPEMLSLITHADRMGGLPQTLKSLCQAAWSVRDRLSMDTWRVVNDIGVQLRALTDESSTELSEVLDELDPLITALVAFSGLTDENMNHNEGWQFLEAGRRLERGVNLATLLNTTLVPVTDEPEESLIIEAVLGITDSLITYRRRYQAGTRVGALLDLVFQNESNPRSLAFQLVQLERLMRELPRTQFQMGRTHPEKLALAALTDVRLAELDILTTPLPEARMRQPLQQILQRVADGLANLSNALTALYFRHEEQPHTLLSRYGQEEP